MYFLACWHKTWFSGKTTELKIRGDEAVGLIDRARFLPERYRSLADVDCAVVINEGITVPTKVYTELVIDLLELKSDDRVLEIGTGSGYQSAVLATVCSEVHTVDIAPIPDEVIDSLPENVFVHREKDGRYPCMQEGEFDAVLVTAGAEKIYEWWAQVLREGGVLVVPIGGQQHYEVRKYVKRYGFMRDMGTFAYASFIPLRRE